MQYLVSVIHDAPDLAKPARQEDRLWRRLWMRREIAGHREERPGYAGHNRSIDGSAAARQARLITRPNAANYCQWFSS